MTQINKVTVTKVLNTLDCAVDAGFKALTSGFTLHFS